MMRGLDRYDVAVPTETGHFVSEKHARIAELIKEFSSELDLLWIPPEHRRPEDPPFAVRHSPLGRAPYIAMYAFDVDETLLGRLYEADNSRGSVLNRVDAHNEAVLALQQKEREEAEAERVEIAASILKSKLHTYRHNGVIYD